MGLVASLASGVSIPLARWFKPRLAGSFNRMGDTGSAGYHNLVFLVRLNQGNDQAIKKVRSRDNRIWRSPIAWQIAIFMGFQSFLFYVTISWLPEILHNHGISMESAGWFFVYANSGITF